MKKRRFANGGETDPDIEAANASDDPIAALNKSKRWTDTEPASDFGEGATSTKMVSSSPEAPAKPKVVTKEELAKSGLSLRDYMNKQQGLTRRKSVESETDTNAPSAYKTRAPYGDRGRAMTEKNYVRRDMAQVADKIDREAQGDATAMKYKTRAPYGDRGRTMTEADYKPRRNPVQEKPASKPFANGGSVKGWGMARGARAAKIV